MDYGKKLKRNIKNQGYTKVKRCDLDFGQNFGQSFEELRRLAQSTPRDEYDKGAGRNRMYGKFFYIPDADQEDKLIPVRSKYYAFCGKHGIEFTQPAEINSDAGGIRRILPPLTDELYRNIALRTYVRFFWNTVPFHDDIRKEPVQIGIHIIELKAGRDKPAVASPPVVHRDGEPFTCAILLDRENVRGGLNAITTPEWHNHRFEEVPEDDVLCQFVLEHPGDGYIVADDSVAHYVGPVHRIDPDRPGHRTVLLIDFVPLRPALILDGIAAE